MGNYFAVVYRERSYKPKRVFSMRLSEEDVDFLKSLPNASKFIRDAIAEGKRKKRILEAKGLPYEIIHEIATAFVENEFDELDEEKEAEYWNMILSWPLYEIAKLTLKMRDPKYPEQFGFPDPDYLEDIIDCVQSKEAKNFLRKIKNNVEQATTDEGCWIRVIPERIKPFDADEIEIIQQIFDDAQEMLSKLYRKIHHKLPPENWYKFVWMLRRKNAPKYRLKLPW